MKNEAGKHLLGLITCCCCYCFDYNINSSLLVLFPLLPPVSEGCDAKDDNDREDDDEEEDPTGSELMHSSLFDEAVVWLFEVFLASPTRMVVDCRCLFSRVLSS